MSTLTNQPSHPSLFITNYKPYYINDFSIDSKLQSFLKTLIEIDYINILLIGSPSSGKTTMLNAIIREYYNINKDAAIPENNILFINNLKEQGIQYFRNEMKTFCQSHSAVFGKKKLVVIDDIDTINEQSQQVFRNYIDKYKKNIHFIFVCTNIQKVIESIQSRLHIIKLSLPSREQIEQVMNKIIHAEKIDIDQESRDYLLTISFGSIRIMINYLEKIFIINKPITLDLCKKICSNISFQKFEEYIQDLQNGNLIGAIDIMNEIFEYGYSVIDILDFFFIFIKLTTMIDEDTKYKIIHFLCKYITIFHTIHEDGIELVIFTNNLFKLCVCK